MNRLTTNRGFWKAFLLSIVTFGFYGWYLVYAFANETNTACKDDGKNTTGLFLYLVFTILTCGIYSIVWDCMWISRCNAYLAKNGKPEGLQVSTLLLTYFLLGALTLGIMFLVVYCKRLYLQNAVNRTYNEVNGL
jgi:magnesium-transporting ATPase (P-type)